MIVITTAASMSLVNKETIANAAKTYTNGSLNACKNSKIPGVGFCAETSFGPYSSNRLCASSSDNPCKEVLRFRKRSRSDKIANFFSSWSLLTLRARRLFLFIIMVPPKIQDNRSRPRVITFRSTIFMIHLPHILSFR